jgi:hypothetical protein
MRVWGRACAWYGVSPTPHTAQRERPHAHLSAADGSEFAWEGGGGGPRVRLHQFEIRSKPWQHESAKPLALQVWVDAIPAAHQGVFLCMCVCVGGGG